MNLFKKLFAGSEESGKVEKEVKAPVYPEAQDNTAAERKTAPVSGDGEMEEFVYHFTGKMNQSQVMKTADGEVVYEAICDKVSLIKDTAYRFVDHLTGEEKTRMIGHTGTLSVGLGGGFSANIASEFKIDGVSVWEAIEKQGYGFRFRMHGINPHYEVKRWGESVGYAESAGTGAMNPKYANSPLGKVPTKGIYRVRCRRSDIPGLFLICFALSRTDASLD